MHVFQTSHLLKRLWMLIDPSRTFRKSLSKTISKTNEKKMACNTQNHSNNEIPSQSSNSNLNTPDNHAKQTKSNSYKKRKHSLENTKLSKMRKKDHVESNPEHLTLQHVSEKFNTGLSDTVPTSSSICSTPNKCKQSHSSNSIITMPTEDELCGNDISNSSWLVCVFNMTLKIFVIVHSLLLFQSINIIVI